MKYIIELEPGFYLCAGICSTFVTSDRDEATVSNTKSTAQKRLWRYSKKQGREYPKAKLIPVENMPQGGNRVVREQFEPTEIPGIPQIKNDYFMEKINRGEATPEDEELHMRAIAFMAAKIKEKNLAELKAQKAHKLDDGTKVNPIKHQSGRVVRKAINTY